MRLCPFPFCFEVLLLPRNFPRKVELGTCRFLKLGFASSSLEVVLCPGRLCRVANLPVGLCPFASHQTLLYVIEQKNSTNFCYRTWKKSVEILVGIRKISRTDFKNNSYGFSNLSCTDSKIFLILYESSGGTNHIHSSNYQMHIYLHHLL